MALATLSIDLEAKLANLQQGMDRAAQITQAGTSQIQRSLDSVKTAGALLGGVIAGAFTGFSTVAFVRGVADGLDALNDLRDATGASIENLSALEDVARRGGTSVEAMSAAVLKFNKTLTAATPDNDVGRIIKSIGLDAEALKQIDPAEALRQVAVALSGYADEGGKARAVQELFGKSTKDVAKFLKDLADQGQLVATVTTKQADEAKKFNDQLDSLAKNSTDTARSLVGSLLPALNQVLESYIKLGGLKGTIKAVFGFDDLSEGEAKAKSLQAAVSLAGDRLASLSEESRRDPGNAALAAIVDKQRARVALLQVQASAAADALKGLADKADPLKLDGGTNLFADAKPKLKVPPAGDATGKSKKDEISEASRALAQYVEQLDRQLQKEQDLTETQKALIFLQTLGTTGEIPQVREVVLQLAKKKEALDAELELQKAIDAAEKERDQALRNRDNEIDAFSGRTADQKKRELADRLEQRIKAGEIFSPEELDRIVKGIAGISTQVKETGSDIENFTKQAATDINDTLGASVNDALRGKFDNIGALWRNMLTEMAARAVSANLSSLLLGDFAKSGQVGGLARSFLDLFKNANGNAFGGSGVIPFANGGVFNSPQLFRFANGGSMGTGVLGEAGPEAVMPLRRGPDGKLGVTASGKGGGTVVDARIGTLNVGSGVSRGEMAAAINQSNVALEQRLRRAQRQGTF